MTCSRDQQHSKQQEGGVASTGGGISRDAGKRVRDSESPYVWPTHFTPDFRLLLCVLNDWNWVTSVQAQQQCHTGE